MVPCGSMVVSAIFDSFLICFVLASMQVTMKDEGYLLQAAALNHGRDNNKQYSTVVQ